MASKNLLILILLILTSISAFTQTLFVHLGPSFSTLNISNTVTSEVQSNNNIVGFNAFLGLEYLDFKYFNLSSAIGYIRKGGNDTIIGTTINNPEGGTYFIKTKLDYFSLNTTANLKLPIKKFCVPFLQLGPRLDYLFSYPQGHNDIYYVDQWKSLNKFSYGLILGGGVNFILNKIKLGLVFDYYWNFNKIINKTLPEGTLKEVWDKTFTLNLQVGFKL